MSFRRQRSWLDFACRDPRLEPKDFRAAYAIWSRSRADGGVQLTIARISAASGMSQAKAAGAVRRLRAVGYLDVEEKPAGGPQSAFLALPCDLPARRRQAAISQPAAARSAVPPVPDRCLPLLRVVADLAAGAEAGRFIPWRQIIKQMDWGPRPKGEEVAARQRRLDAARKRFSRMKTACLDAGVIEVDQARGVRLTPQGIAVI